MRFEQGQCQKLPKTHIIELYQIVSETYEGS